MYFYLDSDRKPQGPYTREELSALLLEGKITLETQVAAKGDTAWAPLGSVLTQVPTQATSIGATGAPDAGTKLVPGNCPSCHTPLEVVSGTAMLPERCPHCGRLLGSPYSGFLSNVLRPLRLYAVISGRATRAEFWSFSLTSSLLQLLVYMLFIAILFVRMGDLTLEGDEVDLAKIILSLTGAMLGIAVAFLFFNLFLAFPQIALLVRRLHDTGRSGWWVFSYFVVSVFVPIVTTVLLTGLLSDGVTNAQGGWDLSAYGDQIPLAIVFLASLLQITSFVSFGMAIALLVFTFMDSQRGPNKYGASPKYPLG